jgi:hypothetical protein
MLWPLLKSLAQVALNASQKELAEQSLSAAQLVLSAGTHTLPVLLQAPDWHTNFALACEHGPAPSGIG